MKLYTGIYYCTESNWDSVYYESRYLLSVKNAENITTEKEKFIKSEYEENKKYYKDLDMPEEQQVRLDKLHVSHFTKKVITLKPEVIQWLEENVADRPKSHYSYEECPKGWCIGSDEYRAGGLSYKTSLWFHRKKDANKFIKTWSKEGLPTFTYNQDTYERKNLVNGKLVLEKE